MPNKKNYGEFVYDFVYDMLVLDEDLTGVEAAKVAREAKMAVDAALKKIVEGSRRKR